MIRRVALVVVVLGFCTLAGCSSSSGGAAGTTSTSTTGTSAATTTPSTLPPAAPVTWLCRPGLAHDPCTSDLDTAVVPASGDTTIVKAAPAADPPVDCFYVYPTVSTQPTGNADMTVDRAETNVAIAQASRFSQVCRVYAPLYRQVTVAGLEGRSSTTPNLALAYSDVLAAWKQYLARDNDGRGVVFIGHSQGSLLLIEMLHNEVDPDPAVRARLVSALIMGGNVKVPIGRVVGGDFKHIPACTSGSETGCVVAYSSFDQTPPPNSLFGRSDTGLNSGVSGLPPANTLQVLCVNPASLDSADPIGSGALSPYFPKVTSATPTGRQGVAPTAPWVTYPGLYTAQCRSSGGATWLQVDTVVTPGDTRQVVSPTLGPTWGLHLVDVNIALGNLVSIVQRQVAAYRR
jgi:hypothetical protein